MHQNKERFLTRSEAAAFLTATGYPTSPRTLDTKVSRGGGPVFRKWGRYAVYAEADLIAWAESRLSAPRSSTSEAAAA